MTSPRTIRVACSPDADDLFMMRALIEGRLDTGPYRFDVTTAPTDELNRMADRDDVDVLAVSIAAYPQIADRWQLLPHGGSMGEGYGPVVVAREPVPLAALEGRRVAIPGLTTTSWAVLHMMIDVVPVEIPIVPHARIFEALRSGEVDAALIIHEGRLTFEAQGFHAVEDLGAWWGRTTGGLPLPLGGNVIRRGLGPEVIDDVSALLRASIRDALDDREAAITWLLGRGIALSTREQVDRYLAMYANDRTLDYGEKGRTAIEILLEQGAAMGLWPEVDVDWA
jgi:1,4-dihydroxy-6-naphthoate synthase